MTWNGGSHNINANVYISAQLRAGLALRVRVNNKQAQASVHEGHAQREGNYAPSCRHKGSTFRAAPRSCCICSKRSRHNCRNGYRSHRRRYSGRQSHHYRSRHQPELHGHDGCSRGIRSSGVEAGFVHGHRGSPRVPTRATGECDRHRRRPYRHSADAACRRCQRIDRGIGCCAAAADRKYNPRGGFERREYDEPAVRRTAHVHFSGPFVAGCRAG